MEVGGECFDNIVRTDSGQAVVVGYVCMGTCIKWFPADHSCKIEHCNKGTPAERCNEYIPQCGGLCEGRIL